MLLTNCVVLLTAIKASIDIMRTHPERVHPKDVKKLEAVSGASISNESNLRGFAVFWLVQMPIPTSEYAIRTPRQSLQRVTDPQRARSQVNSFVSQSNFAE